MELVSRIFVTKFEYFEDEQLPDRNSYAQDHWGFYNGAMSNANLIPEVTLQTEDFDFLTADDVVSGANREPNLTYCQANVLRKIIYPAGGHKEFDYELNEYYDIETEQNIPIGGLRVSLVLVHDGLNHDQDRITQFEYTLQGSNESSGEIAYQRMKFDIHNYKWYLLEPSIFERNYLGHDAGNGTLFDTI